jgi:uncharacterized membrane protein YoaK (UPF0700 family)
MTQAPRQYELGLAEFQRAMAVLQQERQFIGVSRGQRVAYRIYSVGLLAFVLCLVGAVISVVLSRGFDGLEWVLVFAGLGVVSLLVVMLCIPLNFSLMRRIWHQRNNLRRLGLSDASQILWREKSRRRRLARVVAWSTFVLGAVILVGGLIAAFFSVGYIYYSILGLTLIIYSFLQEGKAWLDMVASRLTDITDLQASMLGLQQSAEATGAETIAVPPETFEKLALIDRERIVRGRANAIAESAKTTWTEFSVLTSRDVLDTKAGLDLDARLKVEEAIEKLMQEPNSDSAREDPQTRLLHLPIEGTGREIVYGVDVPERRVRLVALNPTSLAEGQRA